MKKIVTIKIAVDAESDLLAISKVVDMIKDYADLANFPESIITCNNMTTTLEDKLNKLTSESKMDQAAETHRSRRAVSTSTRRPSLRTSAAMHSGRGDVRRSWIRPRDPRVSLENPT